MTVTVQSRTTDTEDHDNTTVACVDTDTGYFTNINDIRHDEYPQLASTTYLDHAGTTPYPKSLITDFSQRLMNGLYGNPHSASSASQLSSRHIDDTRLETLKFFRADPDEFDIVFVANATAAIKLVAETCRDHRNGFWYGYHIDAHTSLVGVREVAEQGTNCFHSTGEIDQHLSTYRQTDGAGSLPLQLIACTAQSNMTGSRPSLAWCRTVQQLRSQNNLPIYSLLDAAAYVSTSPLDLSDASNSPDLTALSFYKMFGFPDLGALIVRKSLGHLFQGRKYFGGGTVDAVDPLQGTWHAKKQRTLHESLEDGTLPVHSILALRSAFKIHARIYGSMDRISRHTMHLSRMFEHSLLNLRHSNRLPVCQIYGRTADNEHPADRGPVTAFNLFDSAGKCFSASEVEKLTIVKGIQIRTGGVCNPGGITQHLDVSGQTLRKNYDSGLRCGSTNDIMNGKATGVLRVSLGASSSAEDVTCMLHFIKEFFLDSPIQIPNSLSNAIVNLPQSRLPSFTVESLSVFPIKSCGAFEVPSDTKWQIGPKGLAWDREWCLVHQGTNVALSQKKHPRMALIRPALELSKGILHVEYLSSNGIITKLEIGLQNDHIYQNTATSAYSTTRRLSNICGEEVRLHIYTASNVVDFFTQALDVPCTLARFPADDETRKAQIRIPSSVSSSPSHCFQPVRSISLSNESPILLVSRSSVNRLNEHIKFNSGAGKAVTADSFRGNIVISEHIDGGRSESPYAEDQWSRITIGNESRAKFEVLGPCQRCQMVCVDQRSAKRTSEPFSTLAKTRRKDGRVWFGMHLCLDLDTITNQTDTVPGEAYPVLIQAGDPIMVVSQ